MFKNFSVGYNLEKNKKIKESTIKREKSLRMSILQSKENKSVLNEEIAQYMLSLGIYFLMI